MPETLDPVALTSRLTAALRAVESRRTDRLFDDPFAVRLAGDDGVRLLNAFGDNETIAVRTRWYDDTLLASGLRQVVIVAAGMDTRAFRLALPAETALYELDRPDVLHLKDRLLADVPPRCHRATVGVDLADDWATPLLAAGFAPGTPTCWLVEGVAQYLAEADVLRLLDRLTELSAEGSELIMDIVGQSLLDSAPMRPMLDRFAEYDAPWRFGTDEPERLVTGRGWRPTVTLISAVGNQYGRWPYPEVPRGTPGVGHGYFLRAVCTG